MVLTATDVGDRDGATTLLRRLDRRRFPRLRYGWADAATWAPSWTGPTHPSRYHLPSGVPQRWRAEAALATAWRHAADRVPFAVVPRRRVVERTLAWLGRYRRLSKDYEYLTVTSQAVIYPAMDTIPISRYRRRLPVRP